MLLEYRNFCEKSNLSEIFNPDTRKYECPLCPNKYCYRKGMNHHVKKFHLLSLPEAFGLSEKIADGGISSDTSNSAQENS